MSEIVNCVVCGRKIDDFFVGEEIVCSDYCKGIFEGRKQGAKEELEKLKQEKYIFDGDLAQYVKLRMLELRK